MTKSTIKIITASFLVLGINFLIQVFLARSLSVYDFGSIMQYLAIASVVQQIILMGTPYYMVSINGLQKNNHISHLNITSFILTNSIGVMLISFIYLLMMNKISIESGLIIICAIPLAYQDILIVNSQIKRQFTLASILSTINPLFRLIFLLIASINFQLGNVTVASAIALSSFLSYVVMRIIKGELDLNWKSLLAANRFLPIKNFKESLGLLLPFGFDTICYILYYQLPILFLGWVDVVAVSNFAIALSLIGLSYMVPAVFFQRVAPAYLSEALHTRILIPAKILQIILIGYIAFSIAVKLCLVEVAPYFIKLFYGDKYDDSIALLGILSWAILARYLSVALGAIFITRDDIIYKNKVSTVLIIVAFSVYFIAINNYEKNIIAYAYVAIELIWMLLYIFKIKETLLFKKYFI